MVRRSLHRSARKSGPRRDVTWGSGRVWGNLTTNDVAGEIIRPSNAGGPTPDGVSAPADATLVRTICAFSVQTGVTSSGDIALPTMGLIAWSLATSSDAPDILPDPNDGTWDWIIRWAMPLANGTETDEYFQFFSAAANPMFTESRAMRRYGTDMGLLFVISNGDQGEGSVSVPLSFAFDVRYAEKLAW